MVDVPSALRRLEAAAEEGTLAGVCRAYGVGLLVAFGSAVHTKGRPPRDLDLAVRFSTHAPDLLGLLDALAVLAGTTELDLMDLGRARPVAREQALVGALVLAETVPGSFAREQMRAIAERMDTAWLRRLDLEAMAA